MQQITDHHNIEGKARVRRLYKYIFQERNNPNSNLEWSLESLRMRRPWMAKLKDGVCSCFHRHDDATTSGYSFMTSKLWYHGMQLMGGKRGTYDWQYLLAYFQERRGQHFPFLKLHMLYSFQSRSERCSLHFYVLLYKSPTINNMRKNVSYFRLKQKKYVLNFE